MADRFYSRLAATVNRRRWIVLAGYLLVSGALGWLGSTITLKADLTDLLPSGTRSGDDLRFYLERFGSTDSLFFTLALRDPGGEEDAESLEEAAALLRRELEETGLFRAVRYGFSEEEGVDLARRTMAHLPVLVPPARMEELRERTSPDAVRAALRRLKTRAEGPTMVGPLERLAAEDPLGLLTLAPSPGAGGPVRVDPGSGLLLSPGGDALLVVTNPVGPPQDTAFSRKVVEAADRAGGRVQEAWPGVSVEHAGGYLFAVQDEARIRHDITWTASISAAAIFLLFAIVMRRVRLLLILMVPLGLSTLWTLGVAAIYPGHLNIVTVAFAAILLGLGDDSLTHLYMRYREEAREGASRAGALRAALASTGPSILVATLTSGLAFAALSFVEFRGLSELGIIAAIGMANLLVSCLFLFPALLSIGPDTIPAREARAVMEVPMGLFVAFHRWAAGRRPLVLSVAALLAVLAALAGTRLEFSSDLKALRGADPAQETMQRVLAPFGGIPDPVYLIAEAGGPDEALRAAERLGPVCESLQRDGLITGFDSPAARLPSTPAQQERFALASGIDWRGVAGIAGAEMEALGMNPRFFAPFFAHLDGWTDWEKVRIETAPAGDAAAISLYPAPGIPPSRIVARARQETAGETAFRAASIGLVLEDLTAVIESDFRRASLLALGAVLLTALAAFRKLSRLFLVGLPVLLGCLLMLGGLSLLGIPINLMNLVATPLVFGLGIDFGVYIVNRHEEEGRRDIAKALRTTGGATLLTGLTTISGFGSLLAADFAGLRSMGWVAVLGIGGCLLSALMILPLLLPGPDSGRRG